MEDRAMKPIQTEKEKEKNLSDISLRGLLDNIKQNNIHIIGIPDREEKE